MSAISQAAPPTVSAASQSKPTSAEARIHWATPTETRKAETETKSEPKPDPLSARRVALEAKFEAMRVRNWITEQMVTQYQKHWNCTREAALERLFAKAGN